MLRMREQFCDALGVQFKAMFRRLPSKTVLWVMWFSLLPITFRLGGG